MTSPLVFKMARRFFAIVSALGIIAAIVLYLGNGPDASEEWNYTTKVMTRIWAPIFALILILASGLPGRLLGAGRKGWTIATGVCGLACLAFPLCMDSAANQAWTVQILMSVAWGLGFFLVGVFLFFLVARAPSFVAWLGCLAGSLFLGLGVAEFWFLLSPSPFAGIVNDSRNSQYVRSGEAIPELVAYGTGQCGFELLHGDKPYHVGHRSLKKSELLFDAKYSLDEKGRRIVAGQTGPVENDLLLFGCSFTFGHGLNDEQTWAAKLAEKLGPAWKLENYAINGYGAQQMLCIIENGLLDAPEAAHKYALFLAIEHHMRRNEFFLNGPHYILDASGKPQREGKPRYGWVTEMARRLNGSQLAAETGAHLSVALSENNKSFEKTYLAMLAQSSRLLREKYGTRLFVLLWPDIDYLGPLLEKEGVSCIYARPMLVDWDKDEGRSYRINPQYEYHPNDRATSHLAAGLALKLRELANGEARGVENDG